MSLLRWSAIVALATFLAVVPAVRAQQFAPHIGYVYPAGGRQGAAIELTIGGQFLDGVAQALVSGSGAQVKVVEHTKPLTPQQANQLKERVQELLKKEKDAAAWKEIAEIKKKLATFVRRPPNPAIAETVTLQVTIAADAEPGQREIRLATPAGLTNPLVFCVGQLPEFSKKSAKSSDEAVTFPQLKKRAQEPQSAVPPFEMNISLPAVVNGQIMPGGVDRYRFEARKGQQLVVAVSARELIPYISDAVPGWFQAALALYDAQRNELAYADDYRFHPDPVIYCQIPKDGQYVIEIRDAIYRGREDFVYRIAVGELPFVTSIFPLGGKAGAATTVAMKGWNLPLAKLQQDTLDKRPGVYPIAVPKEPRILNQVPFAVDTLPECLEQEPNNQPTSAQKVVSPLIANGRIDQPGDWDVFSFEARAGAEIVAEVYARRLGSPLDSVLKLTDATGRQLAYNDDHEDKGSGLYTHHADSWLRATLPTGGTYYLHLGDGQQKGGAEYAYRLRISPPRPDFELRVVPSSVSVRSGTSAALTVYALRKDGFSGEIMLALQNAPAGFTLSGGAVPAQQDKVRLTLAVPPLPTKEPVSLSLVGRGTVQGQELLRPVVPAEDMMQAFAYRHLVPAQELKVAVAGRGIPKTAEILSPTPLKIPAGGTARVQVSLSTSMLIGKLQFELNEPPEGITIASVSPVTAGTEIALRSDAAKAKPGLKGNLIVNILFSGKAGALAKVKAPRNIARAAVGTLPAIPFEIVQP